MKILIATNNKHKVNEIREILGSGRFELVTLSDLNISEEVEEDKDTLEGNALKKAEEMYRIAKVPAIADDTGLFVDALDGEPGVYSSRYAGENATYDDNCVKLLNSMKDIPEEKRTAYFKTVVCFYESEGRYKFFEGICTGRIDIKKRGEKGFGYDPLFIPDGFNKTYAEMSEEEKNSTSHRGKAFKKSGEFIRKKFFD
ncbi:MAG: RdgB/HAM1 family non-canonical purine NTP pyrophosphatase [Ignavibacteriae bacterium]|nr:RdgB/HAM1 family non-canonical purine NTP pyrophosphatase [Ignavibacteriota bacterium]